MTIRYAVTFEFDTQPPVTHKGEAKGTTLAICAKYAFKEAQKAFPRCQWSSAVFVALERLA